MGQSFEVTFQIGKQIKESVISELRSMYPHWFDPKCGYMTQTELEDGSTIIELCDVRNPWVITGLLQEKAPKKASSKDDAYHITYIGDEGSTGDEWNGDDYFDVYRTIHTVADDLRADALRLFRYSIFNYEHGGVVFATSKEAAMDKVIDAYRETDVQVTDEDVEISEDVEGDFGNGVKEVF